MRSMQDDIREFLWKSNMTLKTLAAVTGVNYKALSAFMHRKNGTTIAERIAPYIYGAGIPVLVQLGDALRRDE